MSKLKAKTPGETQPGKTKQLIFGPSGVGKTWFALSFPKPYYLDTEGGADLVHYQERLRQAGGVYMGPAEGTLDFATVIDQVQALATEKHNYQTLIIDSITKLYQTAIAHEAERLAEKDVFGASKKPAIAFMRRLVAWVSRLDMNVVFVAHEVSEWGKDEKTGNRVEIGKTADVWDKLIYELHLTLQCQKRGPQRVAVVRKSRLLGFPEADSFELDYSKFATRYGKDFIEKESTPIVLATAEQVTEINRLLSIVKVDPEEISKQLTKAGAEKFEELNTDQAAGAIAWLNKKLSK
jgi:GTPase SAR1 family protein